MLCACVRGLTWGKEVVDACGEGKEQKAGVRASWESPPQLAVEGVRGGVAGLARGNEATL